MFFTLHRASDVRLIFHDQKQDQEERLAARTAAQWSLRITSCSKSHWLPPKRDGR